MTALSIILPAHNEARLIGPCLGALLASQGLPAGWEVEILVIANGCDDATAARAMQYRKGATARGWAMQVIDVARGGKLNALNVGEAAASGDIMIYLDADVIVSPPLIRQLGLALDVDAPRYASGQPRIAPALSRTTRRYGRFWATLPFMQSGVAGFGLFAMNGAGRARWGQWPDIIADDTFARLNFSAGERLQAEAVYHWPMVEGFANLVRVRRRQNAGVQEIAARFPALVANDDKRRLSPAGLVRRILGDPLGFATYLAVSLAVISPLFRSEDRWARGR